MSKLVYPAARRSLSRYVKHGTVVPEPYDWLEDPASEETKSFVTKQNETFESWMKDFPHRAAVKDNIEKMQNYSRTGAPSNRADRFYFYHNSGLQNHAVLMHAKSLDDKEPQVFLDPNKLSEDGTSALASTGWSESNSMFAYGVSQKGSDWSTVFIRDARDANPEAKLPDKIEWVKYSGISWYKDIGFFYTRFPALEEGEKADKGAETGQAENCMFMFHKIGDAQDQDQLILNLPSNPKWLIGGEVTDDHKFLIVSIHDGCEPHNLVRYCPIPDGFGVNPQVKLTADIKPLADEWIAEWEYLTNNGNEFFFQTTLDAPLRKIVRLNVTTTLLKDATVVVPERASKLDFSGVVHNVLVLAYLEDVKHVLYVRNLADDASSPSTLVPNVPIGSVIALSCRRHCDFVSFKMMSFFLPGRSFYLNVKPDSKLSELTPTPYKDDAVEGLNPDDFEAKQVFVDSTEGAKIPMFICHKKGIELNGSNPTLLYGYGGFNISVTPTFSASRVVFMKHAAGVLAVSNIRGGGEYGEEWHNAGAKFKKQNCYVDFCNSAKWLHTNKYSSPKSLAIMGGSNGGLLVAACVNRAPHLFGAVICQVGVLDMFKFHKFTIGHAWTSDFGDPEAEEDFRYLQEYSPLHNVKTCVAYPPMLCLTGDHDDRVVPLHTHKFVAAMQHANPEVETSGPCLARIEVAAGHGAGKPLSKIVAEAGDTYSFLMKTLGATWTA